MRKLKNVIFNWENMTLGFPWNDNRGVTSSEIEDKWVERKKISSQIVFSFHSLLKNGNLETMNL